MNFDSKEVERLRSVYNEEHPTEPPILGGEIKQVWGALRRRFQKKCKAGRAECIVSSLLKKTKAPKEWKENPQEWLSNEDVEKLEKELEKVFASYECLGTFPIDFGSKSMTGECLVSTLCSTNITALVKKGKTQIGIVFNTDVSTGPGEHWVAVFCDVREDLEYPRMTYFDSYAHQPEKEIKKLMKKWKEQWDKTGVHSKPMQLTYNTTRHQYENSECGMYCWYFHYCCLAGVSMEDKVPDAVVRGFRGRVTRF
jgi:hypothetical protein